MILNLNPKKNQVRFERATSFWPIFRLRCTFIVFVKSQNVGAQQSLNRLKLFEISKSTSFIGLMDSFLLRPDVLLECADGREHMGPPLPPGLQGMDGKTKIQGQR